MHWKLTPIHIIDFEGTPSSGILEYGVVTLCESVIKKTHTRLCRPHGEIKPEEIRLHGIHPQDTQSCLPFAHDWNLFSHLRQTGPLGAHHATVENSLLKRIWPYPSKSPDFLDPGHTSTTWGPWIDTCHLYRTLYPQLKSHKLLNLIETFQLEKELEKVASLYCPTNRSKYHCALFDALASALLLLHLGNLPEFNDMPIDWLLVKSCPNLQKTEQLEQLSLALELH